MRSGSYCTKESSDQRIGITEEESTPIKLLLNLTCHVQNRPYHPCSEEFTVRRSSKNEPKRILRMTENIQTKEDSADMRNVRPSNVTCGEV